MMLSSTQENIDCLIWGSKLGKIKFWSILLAAFCNCLFHLNSVVFHVSLSKAAFHGFHLSPGFKLMVVRVMAECHRDEADDSNDSHIYKSYCWSTKAVLVRLPM